MNSRLWSLVAGLAILLALNGCAKARAATEPVGPPLQVPAPPERVLAPVEEPPLAAAPIPDTPAVVEPVRPARPAADVKPATPPAPAAPATPAPAPPPPPPAARDLQAPSPANAATTERSVRDLLARAARDINQVDYNRLSIEGKSQYEQSKRFSIQAEQALRERNLIFASTLADKAATLAAELLGR